MSEFDTPTGGLWLSWSRVGVKIALKHLLAPIGLVVRPRRGLRTLFYHRVNQHSFSELGLVSREVSVSTGRFERQMAYLARHGYRSLKLDECREMLAGKVPLDPAGVLITFDDGYLDNLSDAAPILAQHGFTAVVFPVVDLVGADNRTMPMGDPEGLGKFMSEDQLRQWVALGHEIGSHTMTHPVLTHVADDLLHKELRQSRGALTELLGKPCTSVAYPLGDVDAHVVAATKAAGYDLGFTTQSGTSLPGSDMAMIKRTEVSVSDTDLIFKLKVNGYFDWLGVRNSKAYRGIMRLVNHAMRRMAGAPKNQTS